MPVRVQRRRVKGVPGMPPGARYVGRGSRWGNPFRVGGLVADPGWWGHPACPYSGVMPPGTYMSSDIANRPYQYQIRPVADRKDATELFRAYVEFHDDDWDPEVIRRELQGLDLACWCPLPGPGEPDWCHGAVLLGLANPAAV